MAATGISNHPPEPGPAILIPARIITPVTSIKQATAQAWEQAPASAAKTPHNGAQGNHGTVRLAQCPKTHVELGRGGCLLSVPERKTSPAPRARLPSYPAIQ
jgi:hypothetical protein